MIKLKGFIKQIFILTLCLVTIFTTCTATYVKADEDITKELKKEIIKLKTFEPNDSLKDLMPLKEILKDKEILGVGQSAFGTSEFLKMKHRMFKFLVEEMGFRAFLLDFTFAEGQVINDYILNGSGDELNAMTSFLSWVWKTDEIKEMLNWMKQYNLKAKDKDKIRFYGIDTGYIVNEYSILSKYLKKVSPTLEKKLLDNVNPNMNQKTEKDKFIKSKEATTEIIKDFETFKNELIEKSSLKEYEIMAKNLDLINQSIISFSYIYDYPDKYEEKFTAFKEECLTKNVKWVKDKEKALGNNKIMISSHNFHLANSEEKQYSAKLLGKHLKEAYGEKYYNLGFEFFKGEFIGSSSYNKPVKYTLNKSNDKTLEYILNKLKTPILYLDWKTILKNNKIEEWFKNREVFINSIVGRYDENKKDEFIQKIDINETFDGFIFINESTPAKPPVYNAKKDTEPLLESKPTDNSTMIAVIVGVSALLAIAAIIGVKVIKNNKITK